MNERNMVTKMQCERDRDEHGTLREGGCEAEATEAVESIDGDEPTAAERAALCEAYDVQGWVPNDAR